MRKIKQKLKNGHIYPWKDWFESKKWHLVSGEDYIINPYVMAMQIRNAASRYGYTVSISIGKGFIEAVAKHKTKSRK